MGSDGRPSALSRGRPVELRPDETPLMEVFPALALASSSPAFFGYRKGPRYNPARKTFRIEDRIAAVDAAMN